MTCKVRRYVSKWHDAVVKQPTSNNQESRAVNPKSNATMDEDKGEKRENGP